jgi:hypothetical protein
MRSEVSDRRALTPIRLRCHDKSMTWPKSLMLRGLAGSFGRAATCYADRESKFRSL